MNETTDYGQDEATDAALDREREANRLFDEHEKRAGRTKPTTPLLTEAARAAREVGCKHVPDQDKMAACERVLGTQTTADPIDEAERLIRAQSGVLGLHAVAIFLHSLPSDATICWGEDVWMPAAVLAMALEERANG